MKLAPFYLLLFSMLSWQCDTQNQIHVIVLDEHQDATTVRVSMTDADGEYFAPVGHDPNFQANSVDDQTAEETDIILDNLTRYAYVDGAFNTELPSDKINFRILKGFEYLMIDTLVDLRSGNDTLVFQLKRGPVSQVNWYSGDVHVHYVNSESALTEMKAEDINVCNLLISDFTIDEDRFIGKQEAISEKDYIVYYNQEYREANLGHVNLLNLHDHLIEPVKPIREHQYPLNTDASDEVHAQGGHISWAHFAAWPGLEAPLGLVLGKVDAIELLCTIDPFEPPIFVSDVVPDVNHNSGLQLWYRLLNCGLNIPLTAGTDKMNNEVTVGANRVYAKIDQEFTYENWIESINKGKTFITNSPLISLAVDDHEIGDVVNTESRSVHITASVWSQLPLDKLEIVANGEVIASVDVDQESNTAEVELGWSLDESMWIAARAFQFTRSYSRGGVSFQERRDVGGGPTLLNNYYGTLRPEVSFSHTSPIYFVVDEKPILKREDAAYFVQYLQNAMHWLEHEGSFPDDHAKAEVLNTFAQGKERFLELSKTEY